VADAEADAVRVFDCFDDTDTETELVDVLVCEVDLVLLDVPVLDIDGLGEAEIVNVFIGVLLIRELTVLLMLGKEVKDGPIGEIIKLYVVCPPLQLPLKGPTLNSTVEISRTIK